MWSRYPTVYCILFLPLSIFLFIHRNEAIISSAKRSPLTHFVVYTISGFSGALNALLYFLTRGSVLYGVPARQPLAPPVRNRAEEHELA